MTELCFIILSTWTGHNIYVNPVHITSLRYAREDRVYLNAGGYEVAHIVKGTVKQVIENARQTCGIQITMGE